MTRFQMAALFLLGLIVLEMGMIAVKMPMSRAQASSDLMPVMMVGSTTQFGCPGRLSDLRNCAYIDRSGYLHVVIEK